MIFAFIPSALSETILIQYLSSRNLREREYYGQYVTESITSSVSLILDSINEISLSIISSDDIRKFLTLDVPTYHSDYLKFYGLAQSALRMLMIKESSVRDIYIESLEGNSIHLGIQSDASFSERETEMLHENSTGRSCWNYEKYQFTICRVIRNIYDVNQITGYMKFVVDPEIFYRLFNTSMIQNDFRFALISQNGEVLIHNIANEDRWLIDSTDFSKLVQSACNLRVPLSGNSGDFYLFPKQVVRDSIYLVCFGKNLSRFYSRLSMAIASLSCLFFVLVVFWLSLLHRKLFILPIERLGVLMEEIDSSDFTQRFDFKVHGELRYLVDRFNAMSDRLQYLYNEVYLGELRLKESEIQNLQKEINPHFLYNTLDSISWMINVGRTESAVRMIHMLSRLFRISLYRSSDGLIPIEKEIEHAMCFIELEKLRMDGKIHFTYDIQTGLDNIFVVKLVLQPLLENAVIHGIIPKNSHGDVSLAIYIQDNDLIYYVNDNGVGFNKKELSKLLESESDRSGDKGIGLYNINQRIKMKFGDEYGLTFHCPPTGGSIFMVRQPIIRRIDDTK